MREFLIVLLILILAGAITLILRKIYIQVSINSLLNGDRKSPHLLYRLMRIRFGSKYLFPELSLMGGSPENNARHYVHCELLFINAAGIFIMRSVEGNGYVDCTRGDSWYRLINDRTIPFTNPFEQNEVFIHLLKSLFQYEKIPNVPIYNIVVFTGKKIRLSQRMNGLVVLAQLVPFMESIGKNHFLKRAERKRLCIAVLKHARLPETNRSIKKLSSGR